MGPGFVLLATVIYLGVIVYVVMLAGRLVRAVERIADKVDRIQ